MSNSQPSKNALTHGFYATHVVLPSENKQEFDDLLQAYQDEYCPEGVSEEAAVFDLACLHWKKRRFEAGLQQALQMHRDPVAVTSDHIGDMARAAAKSQIAAVLHVCESLGIQAEQVSKPVHPNANNLVLEFEKLTVSLKGFNLVFNDLVSLLRNAEEQKLHQIDQAYLPDITERELKIQADIDRRIEKVLKRLVMFKEIKRQYPAKFVKTNQIEATKLPVKPSHEPGGS